LRKTSRKEKCEENEGKRKEVKVWQIKYEVRFQIRKKEGVGKRAGGGSPTREWGSKRNFLQA